MPPFDYRTLYQEEPLTFRGLGVLPQGQPPCGVSQVGPRPMRAPRTPPAYQGLSGAELRSSCNVPDEQFNQRELEMGKPVELEHTTDQAAATCIAKHHLLEEAKERGVPLNSKKLTYYTDLLRTERGWKKGRRRGRGARGLGAWVPEAATTNAPSGPVTLQGEVESKCNGLIIFQSPVEKDRRTGKYVWVAAHKASGQTILRTSSKADARRLAKALCQEIKKCPDVTWSSSAYDIKASPCAYSAAVRAQETWKPKSMLRKAKRRVK